ncbi:YDG/SRA domain-containing protein [Streptomyces sp. BA2]|uniref:YDG/SRA domain-containing protein n=1 Tax=Streptomyces sp. BA2 TaxID=436595 RepID=UPI0013285BA6|nr:hypothetical protein [Streptomyces sp. BA2]
MESVRGIGHISGVAPGAVFHRRADVLRAKLHGDQQRGISTLRDPDGSKVADAIVLNGGYEDDEDHWTWVRYTGASPDKDRDAVTKKLLRSQSWSYADNAALNLSYERKHPVRIVRGYKGDERYSLRDQYRYDGLYEITEVRTATSKSPAPDGTSIQICQFDLHRLPDSQQQVTPVEKRIAELLEQGELDGDDAEKIPESRTTQVQRLVRDAAAARRIKDLYDGRCQVCDVRLVGPDEKPYSEGAHIKPLGNPHGGPDVERNILCLCPNCHVRLDLGSILIEDDWTIVVRSGGEGASVLPKLTVKRGHQVHLDYVRYHRKWWGSGSKS